MKNKTNQTGMTMIEIMVALLIGAFLLGGVLQVFVGSKQTNRMLEALSRMQESGRYALGFLENDIRMAGFVGCPSLKNVAPNAIGGILPVLTNNTFILGADNVASNWNVATCGGAGGNLCIANTDAISLVYGISCGGNLTTAMADVGADIQVAANTCRFGTTPPPLLISNCSAVDIFQATNNASPIRHPPLSTPYGTDAELFLYRAYTYFIRESTASSSEQSLWRLDNTLPDPVELIEGIEDMQILYGIDLEYGLPPATPGSGSANYYVPANQVGALDWNKVVSIRISLLAKSLEGVSSQDISNVVYNGDTRQFSDHRLRRVFTTTISVRNRKG